MEGWVKLHRKFNEWQWATSPNHVALFICLLIRANHKETKWRKETIKAGQLLTGRKQLSLWSGLSEREVRTVLKDLKISGEIDQQTTRHYSIITITKWQTYQLLDQQTTSWRPANDQLTTTSKNANNANNANNEKNIITKPKKAPAESASVRQSYIKSYEERYGIKPVWAAKENALAKKLIQSVGKDEAEKISGEYPFFNDPWHIKQKHPFGLLVAQLDKVRVELSNPSRMLDAPQAQKQINDQAFRKNAIESLYSAFNEEAICLPDQS
jgi:hypothetical protein